MHLYNFKQKRLVSISRHKALLSNQYLNVYELSLFTSTVSVFSSFKKRSNKLRIFEVIDVISQLLLIKPLHTDYSFKCWNRDYNVF